MTDDAVTDLKDLLDPPPGDPNKVWITRIGRGEGTWAPTGVLGDMLLELYRGHSWWWLQHHDVQYVADDGSRQVLRADVALVKWLDAEHARLTGRLTSN